MQEEVVTNDTVDLHEGDVVSEEQVKQVAGQTIHDYLNDEHVKKSLIEWASKLQTRYGNKWFTKRDLFHDTNLTPEFVEQILTLLVIKGNLYARAYGTGATQVLKYKVTLNYSDKILLLREDKKKLEGDIMVIDNEINRLQTEFDKLVTTLP